LFAVWVVSLGVGIVVLALRRWIWGASWLTGVVCAIIGFLVMVAVFLIL